MSLSFALVIPTLNAGERWRQSVSAIQSQSALPSKVLVIDSGSSDNTVNIAQAAGFDVRIIASEEFGHGKTRQLAVDNLAEYEMLVFMTQDAILADNKSLSSLISLLVTQQNIAAVCGRQLPHADASLFAQHLRTFNYPPYSKISDSGDIAQRGIRAAFMSNSFAAYRRSALMNVGGFPLNVIMGEDTFVAAKMLLQGYQVAYCAEASVCHSHNYRISEDFKRYFDTGVFHAREAWFLSALGKSSGEGIRYVRSEYQYIRRNRPILLPQMCLRILCKYLAYQLGLREKYIPLCIKKRISMNATYWKV